jgi:hypothetical protein
MGASMAYVTLMASLPRPLSLFGATQTPISRLKLDRRLRMLDPDDAIDLAAIEDALQWGHLPISLSEDEVLHRARLAMADTNNPSIRQIIRDRLEMRTCVAALRRRRDGMAAPPAGLSWGYGRWTGHIARNWTEASFRLDGVFPWILEADRLLTEDDPVALERLLMQTAWISLGRLLGGHEFDFEAVVIYVLRWNLVDRWVRYDNQAAAGRFDQLVEAGLVPAQDQTLGGWPDG